MLPYSRSDENSTKSRDHSSSVGLLEQRQYKSEWIASQMPNKPRRFPWTSLSWIFLILGTSFIASLSISFYVKSHNKRPSCYCGNNVIEARAMGCKYDSLAAAWLPQACRDDENTAEFERMGPGPDGAWIYYTDWDKTGILTMAEIEDLPNTHGHFFTTHEWHVQHCLYIWRKIWRAPVTGVTIEGNIDTDAHLKHCGDMFMKRDDLDYVATGSGVTLNADHVEAHKGH